MFRFLILLSFIFLSVQAVAQTAYPYQDVKLEKTADYAATEPMALSAAGFLLTSPFIEDSKDRANALLFLSKWVEGTKDYSFYVQGVVQEISGDKNVLSLYIAAMVKYSIDNKKAAEPALIVQKNACKLVLNYCDNEANNFKLKKKLRKILENY